MATELTSRWKRDEQGNIYRVLTDRERAALESSKRRSSSEESSIEPGSISGPSRHAAVAVLWLLGAAAALSTVASALAVLLH